MTEKEIIELFNWTIEEYTMIKRENIKEKYGYLIAIVDIFSQINNYQEEKSKELEQSEICCTEWEKKALDYKAENIALSGDLERTRKALEEALEQINQKEQ